MCMKFIILILMVVVHQRCFSYVISHKYKAVSFNKRQRFLVLHYTAVDFNSSIRALTGTRVSSHYVVPETPIEGKQVIYELVPGNLRAWTQGVSHWRRRTNINDQGISVEIVNLGYKIKDGKKLWFPFPPRQIDTVIDLSIDLIKRYDIQPYNVIGHADCSPGRKEDPGPLFPWKRLHKYGVGAWPNDVDVQFYMRGLNNATFVDKDAFLVSLERYGYNVQDKRQVKSVVSAFQMHFRPSCHDGRIDVETYAILKALLKKYEL